ncbi:MAG: hypothetical protein L3J28_03670 [Candidatus Polarisedimenticolaceae bacterium]|nr:hypothetical protein [Candidatus Polarisedimenticolaceae bacterium]
MPIRSLSVVLLFLLPLISHASVTIDHKIQVKLQPESGQLEVSDQLTLPSAGEWYFKIHAGLNPQVDGDQAKLERVKSEQAAVPVETYRLTLAQQHQVTIRYQGRIQHPLQVLAESPGRERPVSPGDISSEGVFLSTSAAWYPQFTESLQQYRLEVDLPQGWLAVSQGDGPNRTEKSGRVSVVWQTQQPQDDIYLIAAPFQLYQQQGGEIDLQVYLRSNDDALAKRYLDVTQGYIDLYQRLIGPYPYSKFAMVENFWQSGYGMPSFTLLGSRVIRLPFILYTSYPHEILHNWWGNGVYTDYEKGNWSEGLTSYLADHLLKEQRGQGEAYRRDGLQRFQDYVRSGNDFPLVEFRGRHSVASQAVGYDKSLMLYHMLRRELGDKTFIEGLRRFYRENRFRRASYADLQRAFETVGERSLQTFFKQWTQRTGAPGLELGRPEVTTDGEGYRLTARLKQTQAAPPFDLLVPIVVYLAESQPALQISRRMSGRTLDLDLKLPTRPVRIDIDPHYDLFRQLHPEESPASLSKLFGAKRVIIVLPAQAAAAERQAYQMLAAEWAKGYPEASIVEDSELASLPDDRPVWLLGWQNRFRGEFSEQLPKSQALLSDKRLKNDNKDYDKNGHSVVIASKRANGLPIAWIGAESAKATAGLIRKLPHYSKYGLLIFTGDRPTIQVKQQWRIERSPLRQPLLDGASVEVVKPVSLLQAL